MGKPEQQAVGQMNCQCYPMDPDREHEDYWVKFCPLHKSAYESYSKHCGPRAVELAEADLLGEALEACKAALQELQHVEKGLGINDIEAIATIRAVLAKLPPKERE